MAITQKLINDDRQHYPHFKGETSICSDEHCSYTNISKMSFLQLDTLHNSNLNL